MSRPETQRRRPPPATIRPAERRDLDGIMRLEVACFEHPGERFDRRVYASRLGKPEALVLVAEADKGADNGADNPASHQALDGTGGAVVGCAIAVLRRHPTFPTGRLFGLAVHPEARGLGLGRALTQRVIAWSAEHGCRAVTLEVRVGNESALVLYHALGFVVTGDLPDYYGPGVHGLKMRLPLPRPGETGDAD